MINKNDIIENIIRNLDITPTMHKNAVEKYQNLAKYLESQGLECDIYPQGSFALGTIIKPLKNGKRSEYDLDCICLISGYDHLSPKEFRENLLKILKESNIYSEKLKEYDKCLTLEYSDINGVAFNIDILPAKAAEGTFIYLTNKKNTNNVDWFKSNPKGYTIWFNETNDKYPEAEKISNFLETLNFQNSVEKLPDLFERSSLQRVIQILKYHRDSYYFKRKKENKKVISAIITTLCTQIAGTTNYTNLNTINLLEYITKKISLYAELIIKENLDQRYSEMKIIKKTNCKWEILNPVNPADNLADSWNDDSEKPVLFFEWIKEVEKDFSSTTDKEFASNLSNTFGFEYLTEDMKNILETPDQVSPIKPWRSL